MPRTHVRAWLLLLPLLGALVGCADGVDLRVDLVSNIPTTDFAEVSVSLRDGDRELFRGTASPPGDLGLGARIADVSKLSAQSATLTTSLRRLDGSVLVERRTFVDLGTDRGVTVTLYAECVDVMCPQETPSLTECVRGECVDPACGEDHPELCGDAAECTTDDECDDGIPCTEDRCLEGGCLFGPVDDRCSGGSACSALGCVTIAGDAGMDTGPDDTGTPDTDAPADTGVPDTGPADTGAPDTGAPDTGTPDTGAPDTGPADTGSGSPPECLDGCDDDDPCTEDACTTTGCTHRIVVGQTCNDDLFCNGVDICAADGSCQHSGDPCPGTECDETRDTCLGCTATTGCPDNLIGGTEPCVYDDPCGLSGRSSYRLQSFYCSGAGCGSASGSAMRGCSRPTTETFACEDPDTGCLGVCEGGSCACP